MSARSVLTVIAWIFVAAMAVVDVLMFVEMVTGTDPDGVTHLLFVMFAFGGGALTFALLSDHVGGRVSTQSTQNGETPS